LRGAHGDGNGVGHAAALAHGDQVEHGQADVGQGAGITHLLLRSSEAEFMQYRRPVGAGPSSNTWPRCAPHWLHTVSVRTMPWLLSRVSVMAPGMAFQKLGRPQPASNLVPASNRWLPQQMQW